MAKYQDAQGNITEVGNPDLNPDLIAGKTLVNEPTTVTTPPQMGTDPATGLPFANPNQPTPTPATPTPAPTPTPTATPTPDATGTTPANTGTAPKIAQSNNQEYVVQPGDTINAIAQRLGVQPTSITGYKSGNPNRIAVGERLNVSANPATTSTKQSTPLPQNQTAQTGQPTPTTDTGKTPLQNVMDTYTQIYKEIGLGDLKTRYTDVLKEQDKIQQELNDKIGDVNNNPWLSSASRNDQIDKLKEKYTPRLNLAVNQAKLFDSLIQEGEQTAQFLVGHVETDTQKAIELAQKKQDALDALTKDNVLANVKGHVVLVNKTTGKQVADLGVANSELSGDSSSAGLLSVSDAQALGVPYGTTKADAMSRGLTPTKPLTADQAKATGFATRATTANDIIGNLESKISGFNPLSYTTQSKFETNTITNSLASDEIKQSRQAERNFATAVLRQESGAAISQTEFDTLEKQYFPRPGDDATTLAQKAQARQDAISSLNGSAGPGAIKAPTQPSVFHDPKTNKTYTLGADGKYYAQ